MLAWLRADLTRCLGAKILQATPTHGGSINDTYHVRLADGREVFVKAHTRAPEGMFETEARGLGWLREGLDERSELRVPEVLAIDPAGPSRRSAGEDGPQARFMVLEWIEQGRPPADLPERTGRGLAALHRSGAGLSWGLDHDNFVGSLAQRNVPTGAPWTSWSELYRDARLAPLVRSASARGLLGAEHLRRFDRLFARLDQLVGEPEPARLHGDLWTGNLIHDHHGPVLIDPAVYVGAREIDLAMLLLFGRPSQRMFDAYHEVWPLPEDWQQRVPLHQLYPLLVHVELFGAGYVAQVDAALRRYV